MVSIVDVTLRDGLQNIDKFIETSDKIEVFKQLQAAGIHEFEFTSFVSKKVVPTLKDADEFSKSLVELQLLNNRCTGLVLNSRGLERAIETGLKVFSFFDSANNDFSIRNCRMSLEELRLDQEKMAKRVADIGGEFRGTTSMSFGITGGKIEFDNIYRSIEHLLGLGAFEVSFADTVFNISMDSLCELLTRVNERFNLDNLNLHLHGEKGKLAPFVKEAIRLGVNSFDATLGGLGGCPNVDGPVGNLSISELINTLDDLKINHDYNLSLITSTRDNLFSLINE